MGKDREYANNELVYVCRRKVYHLLIGNVLMAVGLFFIYSIVSIPIDQQFSDIAFGVGLSSPFWGTGAYLILSFLKSRRIEFYGDVARVHVGGSLGTIDVPYSEIQLGDLKFTSTSRYGFSGYTHFKLTFSRKRDSSEDLSVKKYSFDVYNGKTIDSDYTIYYWIRNQLVNLNVWHDSAESIPTVRTRGSAYSRIFKLTSTFSIGFSAVFLVLLYIDLTVPFSYFNNHPRGFGIYVLTFMTGFICMVSCIRLVKLVRQHAKFKNTGYDYPYPKDA